MVILDLDCHPKDELATARAWRYRLMYAPGGPYRVGLSAARRARSAAKVGEVVRELQSRWGRRVTAESSRNGIHVVFLLEDPVPVAQAEEIGRRLLWAIGRKPGPQLDLPGASIEVFPSGGRICRIPLTGGARVLGSDLETPKYHRKPKLFDVQELVLSQRVTAADVDFEPPPPAIEEFAAGRPGRGVRGDSKLRSLAGELNDAAVRSLVARPLSGDAFAKVCGYLVRKGIPDDASRGASGKLVALLLYAGVDPKEVCPALAPFYRDPRHRSTRCRRDVATLLSTSLWDVQQGVRLEREGVIHFGGIKRKDLLAIADEILAAGRARTEQKRAA